MKKADHYKIFHVDWAEKRLVSVESWCDEVTPAPDEQQVFLSGFDANETVITSFYSAHPNNRLPPNIANASSGVASFKWSKKFSIPDFGHDSAGVFGTLSFSGKSSFVFISWDAVFEITSSSGSHTAWKNKVKP